MAISGSALDLVIRDGLVVDGSGASARRADLAIRGDRIAAVGAVGSFAGSGAREIGASGRVVAPGFLDVHTHYDAQLCWDGLATPSLEHGVTTVVTGNCSLSLAPVRDGGPARMVGMFQTIEDIRAETFAAGVPWSWESFAEYLDCIRSGLGLNVAPLLGHSALRLYVMGDACQQRAASQSELAEMCRLAREACQAGARGLSLSHLDVDEQLRPVPSRFAELDEKAALARACAAGGGGVVETVPDAGSEDGMRSCIRELGHISREAGVLCTLQPVILYPALPELWRRTLDWLSEENATGARVYGQVSPSPLDTNLRLSETFFPFFLVPSWGEVMRLEIPERRRALADPLRRPKLVEEGLPLLAGFLDCARVGATGPGANRELRGRALSEVAAERGQTSVDALIEIALEDDLDTVFQIRGALHGDPDATAEMLAHPYVMVGASDAGAHLSQMCGAGDTCTLLAEFVRERGDLGLEAAVHRLTGQLAGLWGIADRGSLEAGSFADVVVFDADAIAPGEERFVDDLPGGARRYLRGARGVEWVIVNGRVAIEGTSYTEARAGRIV